MDSLGSAGVSGSEHSQENVPGRRGFLKQAAVALSAFSLPLASCDQLSQSSTSNGSQMASGQLNEGVEGTELASELLDALGDAVLPSEIGTAGKRSAIEDFREWIDGFEPAAEMMHSYGSQEIYFGPPDPAPRWSSQLAALEVVAQRREGIGFEALAVDRRRELIRKRVPQPEEAGGSQDLPGNPAEAEHIAVGLLAWFYGRPEAADLGYQARIGRYTCRPLAQSGERPAPLSESEAAVAVRGGGNSVANRSRRVTQRLQGRPGSAVSSHPAS